MPQPPATLTLRYCATCGWQSPTHAGSHVAGDTFNLCDGTVQTLTYRLDAGQPEPPYEYRAAFRTHDGGIGYSVGSEGASMSERRKAA